jgi:hypothetical protein
LELASEIEYMVFGRLLTLVRKASDFSSEILLRSSEDMLA